jgi:predicted ester cyclase
MQTLLERLRLAAATGTDIKVAGKHAKLLVGLLDELHDQKLGNIVARLDKAEMLLKALRTVT